MCHFLTSNFSKARLKSVEFHPSARVLLTAGLNQKLTLFQVDGKKKLQNSNNIHRKISNPSGPFHQAERRRDNHGLATQEFLLLRHDVGQNMPRHTAHKSPGRAATTEHEHQL